MILLPFSSRISKQLTHRVDISPALEICDKGDHITCKTLFHFHISSFRSIPVLLHVINRDPSLGLPSPVARDMVNHVAMDRDPPGCLAAYETFVRSLASANHELYGPRTLDILSEWTNSTLDCLLPSPIIRKCRQRLPTRLFGKRKDACFLVSGYVAK